MSTWIYSHVLQSKINVIWCYYLVLPALQHSLRRSHTLILLMLKHEIIGAWPCPLEKSMESNWSHSNSRNNCQSYRQDQSPCLQEDQNWIQQIALSFSRPQIRIPRTPSQWSVIRRKLKSELNTWTYSPNTPYKSSQRDIIKPTKTELKP